MLKDKQEVLQQKIVEIIDTLELPKTDSIVDTPQRVAKMLVNELFVGLDKSKFPEYKMFKIDTDYKEPIIVENIAIYSICEHHF